jgi:hypothetical protein
MEQIEALRVFILRRICVRKESVAQLLKPLLYDHSPAVVQAVLELVCKSPHGISLVSQFLSEILHHSSRGNAQMVECLSLLLTCHPTIVAPFAESFLAVLMKLETRDVGSLRCIAHLIVISP